MMPLRPLSRAQQRPVCRTWRSARAWAVAVLGMLGVLSVPVAARPAQPARPACGPADVDCHIAHVQPLWQRDFTTCPAQPAATKGVPRGAPDCACDCQDPYEPRLRMQGGPYDGLCLATCGRRTVTPLSDAPRGVPVPAGHRVLANVQHKGVFVVAVADPAGVQDVWLQQEQLSPPLPAAHSQLRFRFAADAPVALYVVRSDAAPYKLTDVFDLVLSVAPITPTGATLDPGSGLRADFPLVFRLTTLDTQIEESIVHLGHRVRQYGLVLTAAERTAVFEQGIDAAAAHSSYTRRYHLLSDSCVTELLAVVERGLESASPLGFVDPFYRTMESMVGYVSLALLGEQPPLTVAGARTAARDELAIEVGPTLAARQKPAAPPRLAPAE